MRVAVNISLKNGILDPQGKAVHHALDVMNFKEVKDVRIGKRVVIELDCENKEEAITKATEMAKRILANEVTEDFSIEII